MEVNVEELGRKLLLEGFMMGFVIEIAKPQEDADP